MCSHVGHMDGSADPIQCEPFSAGRMVQAHCKAPPTADFLPFQLPLPHVLKLSALQWKILSSLEHSYMHRNKYLCIKRLSCCLITHTTGFFPLVCTAHWMDPLKWRRNGENRKCSSGTVYSETMSFNSVYHKIHFHFISILSQGGIIWQDTSTMWYNFFD